MTVQSKEFLTQFLKSDPTISPEAAKTCLLVLSGSVDAAKTCLSVLSGSVDNAKGGEFEDRVLSRQEAARFLGVGLKRLDDFSRSGMLERVYFPGCKRASGVLLSSVRGLMTNRGRVSH